MGSTALEADPLSEGSGLPQPGSLKSTAEGAREGGSKKSDKEKAIEAADLMKDIEELPEIGSDLIEDEEILDGTALDAQDDNLVGNLPFFNIEKVWDCKAVQSEHSSLRYAQAKR